MTAYPHPYELTDSARAPGWFQVECDWCDWYSTGHEPVCEDAWYEHVDKTHSRRFRFS